MKTIKEYNEIFEGHKSIKKVTCKNGRTYYFQRINESDWMFSYTSKRTEWKWDDEKLMTYDNLEKFLRAVKRILKTEIA